MSTNTSEIINRDLLKQAMSFNDYMELFEELVKDGKTSGKDQSMKLIEYTKMNLRRMRRLLKTIELKEDLSAFLAQDHKKITFLVLSEVWCGDAAQNLPLLNKMAEHSDWLDLKIVLRDENLELMDQFLTNGGRSIPKVVVLDNQSLEVLGEWGPRPQEAQEMVKNFKKLPNGDYEEFVKQVQLWYAKNKTHNQQEELLAGLKKWCS